MSIVHENGPVVKHSPSILIPAESYIYLSELERSQRCGDSHGEKWIEKVKADFENDSPRRGVRDHKKEVINGIFGGAVGDPENSWEEHRWTEWSVEKCKQLLDEAGLPYEDGPEIEYAEA